ncbi:Gfo/Idh/MocA family oxidoreductase [Natronosporangium hydrolyticum]|uniref:Gfo/Idh/MocA family oxidoreductase n=1 Tax=Natronosporangium hydrolyticum TaxID=2811111 RepID=A0A895YGF3_9ACTN|nr:Gfo/Idh/MocA family oxidoreductase [Natronosporangium hydrolyticum]QSB15155.1 Gfo/Idh/MocA family oxidoreductase [Natronosporangium hydrolyticum]
MSDRPVRWGILATGSIARTFVEDLQTMPDAEVVAVGSRTQAAADEFAQRHQIPRAYGDWASLAADEQVDVVYVATPHAAHYEAAKLCLTAGRAVLCEKPVTLSRQAAAELVALAREAGVFFMEAMWTRCNPVIRRVAERLADGAIGEVTAVHADFGLPGPVPPEHRLRDPALGGGALLDLGIYPLTLAHLVLGTPATISAQASLTPEGVDQQTGLLLGYDSGAIAALTCGFIGGTRIGGSITGRHGRIELEPLFFRPERAVLHPTGGGSPEPIEAPLVGNGYVPQAAEVHRCLRAGLTESPLVPHETTLAMMSIMDTVRQQIGVAYPGEPAATDPVVPRQRSGSPAPAAAPDADAAG